MQQIFSLLICTIQGFAVMLNTHEEPLTNYIMQLLVFFDHPLTCNNTLTITLPMNHHNRVCDSNAFMNLQTTPSALRNF